MMASLVIHAQEPEKKKASTAPSRGQERAINESGVAVKSEPSKSTKTKCSQPPVKEEPKKKEQIIIEAKKPE